MGGLTFACIMARLKGWRVLVLERHFKIGGFTHTFERPGGWSWDVGLHYVGEVGKGMLGRRLFDFITNGGVAWTPLPEVFDKFVYPDLCFSVPGDPTQFQKSLVQSFPEEQPNIEQYFRDLKSVQSWLHRRTMAASSPPLIARLVGW